MGWRYVTLGVWVWALGAGLTLGGCGLALDYGPPDRAPMDAAGSTDSAIDVGATGCEGGCDDGLRCTADSCVSSICQHTDTCPGDTDCVSRAGVGECRLPCSNADECADGIDCTADRCEPDGHCAHTSTCDATRPACLASGACAPSSCTGDAECSDGDLCNGEEHCVSGVCRGGVSVHCDAGAGCMTRVCDASTGTCAPSLDDAACSDGLDCTTDRCNPDGSCAHPPNDAACAGDDRCVTRACDPSTSTDATGCVSIGGVACATACGTSIACDPTTGLCDYAWACPVGQVCRADGCHSPGSCLDDTACADIHGPGGCATHCAAGTCQAIVCPLPPPGSCAAPNVDGMGCPRSTQCFVAQPALCDDADPLTIDVCNPDTFACSHACPAPSPNDCVSYTYAGGHCVPTFDATVCSRLHPSSGASCARFACVGHGASSGGDGCAVQGSSYLCDDLAACTDDTCEVDASAGTGTCTHAVRPDAGAICDDMIDCTVDACTPGAVGGDVTGCTHAPSDAMCSSASALECAAAVCGGAGVPPIDLGGGRLLPSGCGLEYMPTHCDRMSGEICTLDGQCGVVPCGAGAGSRCDDGNACNGLEVCAPALGRCTQTPPVTMCVVATTP